MRETSNHPSKNSMGGWLHRMGDDIPRPQQQPDEPPTESIDASAMMARWQDGDNSHLLTMTQTLGVTRDSFRLLGAAWAPEHRAAAFPMLDRDGSVLGIRLRNDAGKKWAVKGSHQGLFYSVAALNTISTNRIMVCEGPTDTAACLSLGYWAIGRPSCSGSHELVANVLRQLSPNEVVIVTDNDGPGIEGAKRLVAALKCPSVYWIPPGKDIRQFLVKGGTRAVIDSMLSNMRWNTRL